MDQETAERIAGALGHIAENMSKLGLDHLEDISDQLKKINHRLAYIEEKMKV